ncbi:hypothetical protein ATCC90586_003503 [Pythium insidiosum]|nr:hypothetical protein ATCC90586_003503 [Pythium insidiosum]
MNTSPPTQEHDPVQQQDPDSNVAAILTALAPYPDLLATYARQLNKIQTAQQRPPPQVAPELTTSQVLSFPGATDILSDHNQAERQHGFRPSRIAQDVHRVITSSDYTGKAPDSFFDHVRISKSTKFFPHPGILSRLFDFQFGPGALSVLHLSRFNLSAQLDLPEQKVPSMWNYTSAPPEVTKQPALHHIGEALDVLAHYASEFCEVVTRSLVSTAKEFCSELSDYGPWSTLEVKGIALWFTKVFAAYRLAIINDLSRGSDTRQGVEGRLSLQDAELRALLLKLSRSTDTSHPPYRIRGGTIREGGAGTVNLRQDRLSDQEQRRKTSKLPADVVTHIPKDHHGRQLCLKSISSHGCPSPTPDECIHPYLAHFAPRHLHPKVRQYVSERLGGVNAPNAAN